MKVSVIGLGYIGLPTAAIIASHGIKVTGVDVNPVIVNTVNEGKVHIIEPNLDKLVKETVDSGNFIASIEVSESDIFIIAVPTPFKEDHKPDISFVEEAARSLAPYLKKGNLVILESTCPVGTTEEILKLLQNLRGDLTFPEYGKNLETDVSIVYCPERVLPGNILEELVHNNRIIGGVSSLCSEKALTLYKNFVQADCLVSDCRTAELSKLTENSFRDVNIAFANELSIICDDLNIDVWKLINLANQHPRVNILTPGPGVGGHCIAVDPWFIIDSSPQSSKLIKSAREVNDNKPIYIVKKINEQINKLDKEFSELNLATFGLAFKPDIDDLRESPALEISKKLNIMGFKNHYVVEPNIEQLPEDFNKPNTFLSDQNLALKEADIMIFLVNHKNFKLIKREQVIKKLTFDVAGIFTQ
jgi:UDP-N-acetyl-D-mannosaminuronic acid dehydrogenase